MSRRMCTGDALDLVSCTLPHSPIYVRQSHTRASTFVLLRSICAVGCVDRLKQSLGHKLMRLP